MVEKIFLCYGSLILLEQGNATTALKGFLQPRKSVSQRNAMKRISPLGEIAGDTYLFIGPVECGARAGDTLLQNENTYELRQVETVIHQNMPIYLWGLCVQKGGVDSWDY